MDKEYASKYNLLEEQKRFQSLLEYSFNEGLRNEAPQTPQEDPAAQGGMPPMDNNAGAAPAQDAAMPPMDGNAPTPPMDNVAAQPPMDDSQTAMNNADGAQTGADNFNPQPDATPEQTPMPEEQPQADGMQEGDEVVDVDELTDAQEESNEKIDHVSKKFDKVMDAIGQLEDMIRQNDSNIERLGAEMEKRNPSDIEKMSLRSKNSYPFNVGINDYWDDKEETSNYRTDDDENGVGQEKYNIYQKDIDDATDWNEIAHSLDDDSDMIQPLSKIFSLK